MEYFTHIDKEKLVSIFNAYKTEHGDYPTTNDIEKLKKTFKKVIPSIRWIQNHGGLLSFYNSLGINYIDARTGIRRSSVATEANKKSMSLDVSFSSSLIKRYGERNVHWQSPYNDKGLTLHRSDFKVYKNSKEFFFIDLFFPKDIESLIGCLNIKIKKLNKIDVTAPIYLVCCNETDISHSQIERYINSRKSKMPSNIKLLHISDARVMFF